MATTGEIVGIFGNIIYMGLFLSPWPKFSEIIRNEEWDKFKPDPYIITVLNCMLWIFYGMPFVNPDPDSLLITTINSFGLYIEVAYLGIFLFFSGIKGQKIKVGVCLVIEVIFMVIVILITFLVFHETTDRLLVVRLIGYIFTVMMYVSPLTIMKEVITTKSVKYMSFTLSLAIFLNGCIWTIYGLIKFDNYVWVSNGVGAVSGFFQLIIYAYYSRRDPKIYAENIEDNII